MACAAMKESPGNRSQRCDVTERANKEQRAAAQPVNEPQANKGENEIGNTDADGLQQRGFRTQAGKFKYARREVKNRIDARELVEECYENGQ